MNTMIPEYEKLAMRAVNALERIADALETMVEQGITTHVET